MRRLIPLLKKYDEDQERLSGGFRDDDLVPPPRLVDVEPGIQDHGLGHYDTQLTMLAQVGAWEAARILGEALREGESAEDFPNLNYLTALAKTGNLKTGLRLADTAAKYLGRNSYDGQDGTEHYLAEGWEGSIAAFYEEAGFMDKAEPLYRKVLAGLNESAMEHAEKAVLFFKNQGLATEAAQALDGAHRRWVAQLRERAKARNGASDEFDLTSDPFLPLFRTLGLPPAKIAEKLEEAATAARAAGPIICAEIATLHRDAGDAAKCRVWAKRGIAAAAPQGVAAFLSKSRFRFERTVAGWEKRRKAEETGADSEESDGDGEGLSPDEFSEMGDSLDAMAQLCELADDLPAARQMRTFSAKFWMHPSTHEGHIWGDPLVQAWNNSEWFAKTSKAVIAAGEEAAFVPAVREWIEESRTSMTSQDLIDGQWMLARCLWGSGQKEEARRLMRRMMGVSVGTASRWLALLPPEEAAERLTELQVYTIPFGVGDAQMAAEAVLQFKAAGLEMQMTEKLIEEQARGNSAALVRELRDLRQRLLSQFLGGASDAAQAGVRERIQAIRRQLLGSRDLLQSVVTPDQVTAALPPNSALVDWVKFPHSQGGSESYAAVIFRPGAELAIVDFGDAVKIDEQIRRFANAVRNRPAEVEPASQSLAKLIWQPLEGLTGQSQKLFLSPDGLLNFVSFAALPAGDRLAGERHEIVYLASARDVLSLQRPAPGGEKTALLVGAPDYADPGPASHVMNGNALLASRSLTTAASGLRFSALPGTQAEVQSLQATFRQQAWQASVRTGEGASEKSVLAGMNGARVIHLATHGFFLDRMPGVSLARTGSQTGAKEFPLLRSGLALTGANTTVDHWKRTQLVDPDNDGFLLASELGALNLSGTELLVLSACDTGVGTAAAGDGVLGLRRACAQAGARNVMLTLWPVGDQETVGIMEEFYREWLGGKPPSAALHHAQKQALARMREQRGLASAITFAAPFVLTVLPDLTRATNTQTAGASATPALQAAPFDWRGQDRPRDIVNRQLYYSGDSDLVRHLANLYDDTAHYYGKRLSRQEIAADNIAYLEKSQINLAVDGEPDIQTGAESAIVKFDMEYWTRNSSGRESHGIRPMLMRLRRDGPTWKITELNPAGQSRTTPDAPAANNTQPDETPEDVLRRYLAASMDDSRTAEAAGLFADAASYFGTKMDRGQILRDAQEYAASYPSRTFSVSGPIQRSGQGDTATLRYQFSFVSEGAKRSSGTRPMVMQLQRIGGVWRIISLNNAR